MTRRSGKIDAAMMRQALLRPGRAQHMLLVRGSDKMMHALDGMGHTHAGLPAQDPRLVERFVITGLFSRAYFMYVGIPVGNRNSY